MAGIQLSGLASGFDWKSLVDQLMSVNRIPQDNLRTEKTTLSTKTNAINELKTQINDLQTSLKDLTAGSSMLQRSAKFGTTTSTWTSAAAAGTATGSYKINVSQLATAARLNGKADAGSKLGTDNATASAKVLSSLNLAQTVTAGDFTINGSKISVATTDTLGDVFSKISTATGSTVTAEYDPTSDGIKLTGGSIVLGSANDTSNFLQAFKLNNNATNSGPISSATSLGITKMSVPIASSSLATTVTGDASGNGSLSINGTAISYNVNTDSLQTILTKINDSGAGVTASYDGTSDKFTLTNKVTGDIGVFAQDTSGNLLEALGLKTGSTTTVGKNAEFKVNDGATIVSRTNTLDATAHGITGLSVTANSEGTETVTVAADTSGIRTKLDAFISKYNTLQNNIESKTAVTSSGTKVTTGTLYSNREITEIGRSLRSLLYADASSTNSTIKRMSDMGIDFSGTGTTLAVKDGTALDKLLLENSSDVMKFFGDSTNGLVKKMSDYIDRQAGTSGTLVKQVESNTRQSNSLDTQIANMERDLTSQRSLLENTFIQMETAQSVFQQQAQALTKAFFSN